MRTSTSVWLTAYFRKWRERCILRAFVGWGLLQSCDAKDMLAYQHSGFSLDAGDCIGADDRAALAIPPRTHLRCTCGRC